MRPLLPAFVFVAAPWLVGPGFAVDAAARSQAPAPEHLELWIRVARGRAELVGRGLSARVDDLGAWRHVDGRGELRLEARAEASVRWPGRASVDLVGPTRVRFEPDDDGGLRIELVDLASTSIELRRGALELSLAGGWQSRITPGVVALQPLGASRFAVERVVGDLLRFERFGPGRAARIELGHGGRAELAYELVERPSGPEPDAEHARAAVWPDVRWPWHERPASHGLAPRAPEAPPARTAVSAPTSNVTHARGSGPVIGAEPQQDDDRAETTPWFEAARAERRFVPAEPLGARLGSPSSAAAEEPDADVTGFVHGSGWLEDWLDSPATDERRPAER